VTPAIANAPCTTPALGERLREVAEVAARHRVHRLGTETDRATELVEHRGGLVDNGRSGRGRREPERARENAPSPPP
jgi:hypothetical protein